MAQYEEMWRKTAEENAWLWEQVERLKGNKRENPTLRDQFAMAALPAIIKKNTGWECWARECYEVADMMLEERERR